MEQPIRAFRFVHESLVRELEALEEIAAALHPEDDREVAQLASRFQGFLDMVEDHEHFEEAELFPAIDARAPDVVGTYEIEHRACGEHLTGIGEVLSRLPTVQAPAERVELARRLRRHATALNAVMGLHIAKENAHLIPLAERVLSPAEQGALLAKIGQYIPPERLLTGPAWIGVRLSPDGREDFLRTYRPILPPPFFAEVVRSFQENLAPADWEDVVRRMPELASPTALVG
jgi:zinc finger protein-like protein